MTSDKLEVGKIQNCRKKYYNAIYQSRLVFYCAILNDCMKIIADLNCICKLQDIGADDTSGNVALLETVSHSFLFTFYTLYIMEFRINILKLYYLFFSFTDRSL